MKRPRLREAKELARGHGAGPLHLSDALFLPRLPAPLEHRGAGLRTVPARSLVCPSPPPRHSPVQFVDMFSTSTGPKALCEARCLLSKNGNTARRPSREFLNEVGRPDLAHTRPGLATAGRRVGGRGWWWGRGWQGVLLSPGRRISGSAEA